VAILSFGSDRIGWDRSKGYARIIVMRLLSLLGQEKHTNLTIFKANDIDTRVYDVVERGVGAVSVPC
jgi:hypothetical protein